MMESIKLTLKNILLYSESILCLDNSYVNVQVLWIYLPEFILPIGSLILLFYIIYKYNINSSYSYIFNSIKISFFTLILTFISLIFQFSILTLNNQLFIVYNNWYLIDMFTTSLKLILSIFSIFYLLTIILFVNKMNKKNWNPEYFLFILFIILASFGLISSSNWLFLFILIEVIGACSLFLIITS